MTISIAKLMAYDELVRVRDAHGAPLQTLVMSGKIASNEGRPALAMLGYFLEISA